MSRRGAFIVAAVIAALLEAGCLWVLTHVVSLRLDIAFAAAFAVGYATLFAALALLDPSDAKPLGRQLRSYALFGVALVLLVEVVLYVCVDGLGLSLVVTNVAALAAVACWLALGWPYVQATVVPRTSRDAARADQPE